MTADATKRKSAAPLARVASVRIGASQNGADTRGTSEREGTGAGSAAMRRAVSRSSARRVRHTAQLPRCVPTAAFAEESSASSMYADSSTNGCTVLASFPYNVRRARRFPHPAGPFQPRATSAFRTARRPRWMRDLTVPISTVVIEAISS